MTHISKVGRGGVNGTTPNTRTVFLEGISMQGRVWVYLSAGQRMQQAYIYVIMYTFVCKYVNDLHVDDIIVYKIPLIIHPCVYM